MILLQKFLNYHKYCYYGFILNNTTDQIYIHTHTQPKRRLASMTEKPRPWRKSGCSIYFINSLWLKLEIHKCWNKLEKARLQHRNLQCPEKKRKIIRTTILEIKGSSIKNANYQSVRNWTYWLIASYSCRTYCHICIGTAWQADHGHQSQCRNPAETSQA